MITHLLFDCDGVLVDSEIMAARITLRVLRRYGLQAEEAVFCRTYCGMMDREILAHLRPQVPQSLPEEIEALIVAEKEAAFENELPAIKGMPELVKKLPGLKAVISNSWLSHVERAVQVIGLQEVFGQRVFSSDQVARPKPHPDLYLFALQHMGIHPEQALVIEDSQPGVQAAKAAGLAVIGFLGGGHIRSGHAEKLQELGADYLAADAAALSQLLLRFPLVSKSVPGL